MLHTSEIYTSTNDSMHKSKFLTVVLAAILFTGALTAAIPSFMVGAEASNDKKNINYKDKEEDTDSEASDYDSDRDATDSEESTDKNYINYKDVKVDTDSEESTDDNKDRDATDSESSNDKRNIKNNDGENPSYNKPSQDYEQKSNVYQDNYQTESGYYDESSAYGGLYKKPTLGTDVDNDYDKNIFKKIIVVCPDGSKIPVNGNIGVMTSGVYDSGEYGLIDNVIEEVCPAIDSCEECFQWLLNFVDNRTESVAIINTVIDALNEQTPTGQSNLDSVEVGFDGYEGPSLWKISEFFNRIFEGSTNQGQTIAGLINSIKQSVDSGEVTPIAGSLAVSILECIAELEGIELPLTSTNGNNNQNQTLGFPSLTSNNYSVR